MVHMGRATEGRIIAAAQAAHAMEFIREMPQGLQTLVGEQGVRLVQWAAVAHSHCSSTIEKFACPDSG